MEASFIVEIGLPEAVAVGRRFRQEAVFYVDVGLLQLVDCGTGDPPAKTDAVLYLKNAE